MGVLMTAQVKYSTEVFINDRKFRGHFRGLCGMTATGTTWEPSKTSILGLF